MLTALPTIRRPTSRPILVIAEVPRLPRYLQELDTLEVRSYDEISIGHTSAKELRFSLNDILCALLSPLCVTYRILLLTHTHTLSLIHECALAWMITTYASRRTLKHARGLPSVKWPLVRVSPREQVVLRTYSHALYDLAATCSIHLPFVRFPAGSHFHSLDRVLCMFLSVGAESPVRYRSVNARFSAAVMLLVAAWWSSSRRTPTSGAP